LIRRALAHPDWALGFEDEVWFSRLARPGLHTWSEPGEPLRLQELTVVKEDPEPKALACYGLLVRWRSREDEVSEQMWLRFVDGRPVSGVTTQFLAWCCAKAAAAGKTALLMVWDNASWHGSKEVRGWIKAHNRRVKQAGTGVRLVVCPLPSKSPWLNPIEAKWVHGKRRVVEPERVLSARELEERVCAVYGCPGEPHLAIPESVA
jgi:transposase